MPIEPLLNHGSIGNILENVKYLGDDLYPQVIVLELIKKVQEQRQKRRQILERIKQPNSMANK